MKSILKKIGNVWIAIWVVVFVGSNPQTTAQAAGPDREQIQVSEKAQAGSFPLVADGKAAEVWIDGSEPKVVQIAAGMLAQDIDSVTSVSPQVRHATAGEQPKGPVIILGTLEKSGLIADLIKRGKFHVGALRGKWESFEIETVAQPFPGVDQALVIAGSDRRGAAYGALTLSEAIGVSPWVWWADVTPAHRAQLFVKTGSHAEGPPSVKYRGIFINDEDFGIRPWASKTFDPKLGNIGPKTYTKVFELLLRLKGNTLWPAMHGGSTPFNRIPENARLADDYGIVMGSSHCEPMLRNNVGEWDEKTQGEFNYATNRDRILNYWAERVHANGAFENIYTLGIRGIHDSQMLGGKTTAEKVTLLQQVLDDQRAMLKRDVNPNGERLPQIFCAYKEVLGLYQHGLKVPDDVTLMWADDNHGYIRNLSTPEEQKRSGSSGVYYHLSYWGDPECYLWLSSISPGLMAFELGKAYAYGADRIWIFNVGDIKPAEKELTFAMQMAWDVRRWNISNAGQFMPEWAKQTFGLNVGGEIGAILNEYDRLALTGKPEHIYLNDYSGHEIEQRLAAYRDIEEQVLEVRKRIPAALQDAYFELVLYPVLGAQLINEKTFSARFSWEAAVRDHERAREWGEKAKAAYNGIKQWTTQYNQLAGGKWRGMMNDHPRNTPQFGPPDVATESAMQQGNKQSPIVELNLPAAAPDGSLTTHFSLGDTGKSVLWLDAALPAKSGRPWTIHVNQATTQPIVAAQGHIANSPFAAPHWTRIGEFELQRGLNSFVFESANPRAVVTQAAFGLTPPFPPEPLAVISALDFSHKHEPANRSFKQVSGLPGGLTLWPLTASALRDTELNDNWVEYTLPTRPSANILEIRCLPTLRIHAGRGLRFAVSIDGGTPKVFDINTAEFAPEWRANVLRGYTVSHMPIPAGTKPTSRVRITILDPGLVLQELRVYAGSPALADSATNR